MTIKTIITIIGLSTIVCLVMNYDRNEVCNHCKDCECIALADLDNDDDLDAVSIVGKEIKVYKNDNGAFVYYSSLMLRFVMQSEGKKAIAIDDVNKDGEKEIVIAAIEGVKIFENPMKFKIKMDNIDKEE